MQSNRGLLWWGRRHYGPVRGLNTPIKPAGAVTTEALAMVVKRPLDLCNGTYNWAMAKVLKRGGVIKLGWQ